MNYVHIKNTCKILILQKQFTTWASNSRQQGKNV